MNCLEGRYESVIMMPNYTAVALVVLIYNFTCTCQVIKLAEGASCPVSEGWYALALTVDIHSLVLTIYTAVILTVIEGSQSIHLASATRLDQ